MFQIDTGSVTSRVLPKLKELQFLVGEVCAIESDVASKKITSKTFDFTRKIFLDDSELRNRYFRLWFDFTVEIMEQIKPKNLKCSFTIMLLPNNFDPIKFSFTGESFPMKPQEYHAQIVENYIKNERLLEGTSDWIRDFFDRQKVNGKFVYCNSVVSIMNQWEC